MKRTTIYLPEGLHERLREQAFRERVSMAELIRLKLEAPQASSGESEEEDPLLAVAGIINDGTLTKNLDQDLYDL